MLSLTSVWVGLCIATWLFVRDVWLFLPSRSPTVKTRRSFAASKGPVNRARRAIATSRRPFASRGPVEGYPVQTRPSGEAVAAWCHAVKYEDAPLLSQTDGSRISSDWDAESNEADGHDRAASPVSTVANWSTVTGTPSLGQSAAAPPPYTSWTTRYADC